jgi:hypothetical protein
MKVTGPGSGLPPEAAKPPEEASKPAAGAFADKIKEAGAGPTGTSEAGLAGITADIGADLVAGRITREVAIERVIGRIIERQIGPEAPTALREQVSAALRQALEDDPMLAAKVRGLGA